jgi:hypothetical protein
VPDLSFLLMAFDDQKAAAFTAIGTAAERMLAFATATIGGAIALFDDGQKAGVDFGAEDGAIRVGLFLLGGSVVSGLMTLGAVAGQLGNSTDPQPYAPALRMFYGAQLALYGFGLAALIWHTLG